MGAPLFKTVELRRFAFRLGTMIGRPKVDGRAADPAKSFGRWHRSGQVGLGCWPARAAAILSHYQLTMTVS